MIRKIFKTGHSLAITVSKKSLNELGWHEGDSVEVVADKGGEKIVIKRKERNHQLVMDLKVRPKL